MVTAPSLCHGDTEGPAFRGCSRLCTIVGGRGQVSSGIVVQVHHSTASRGPGRCWVSPTHTRKEARSSPSETALGRQWIEKHSSVPGNRLPSRSSASHSPPAPCRGRGGRLSPASEVPGTCPRPTLRQKITFPGLPAESLRLISALLVASTPYLQGAGPGAPFKTLSVLIH